MRDGVHVTVYVFIESLLITLLTRPTTNMRTLSDVTTYARAAYDIESFV